MFRNLRWLFGFGPYPGVHYYDDRVEFVVELYRYRLGKITIREFDDHVLFVEVYYDNGEERIALELSSDEYDIKHISSIDYHFYGVYKVYKKNERRKNNV